MEQSPSLMTIASRNSIYEFVCLGAQTVRREALPLFSYLAPTVAMCEANVHNFDFTQLIAFTDRLDAELRKAIRREGRLQVMLSLDEDFDLDARPAADANLKTWLRYCDDGELCWHKHASTYYYVGTMPHNLSWIDALTVKPNHIGSFPLNASMATEWHDMCMAILLRDFIGMRGGG
ncbi:hypothetical protein LTR17_005230 [Elasticomyces elasticus]|nr:hypothetical protein LTR17_005230 [Elasticomyces elasticus]